MDALRRDVFEIAQIWLLGRALADPIDAPAAAVDAAVIVAFAGVAPVEQVGGTFRPLLDVDAAEPLVAGEEDVILVLADVATAVSLEPFYVGAQAVHVERVESIAHRLRPLLRLVDHHADVRVATAEIVGLAIT